jgi:hypothetical protein
MNRLFKRGLLAATAVATVTTPVAVLATQAGAQPTKGAEALNVTIYEVGTPPSNPTGSAGGGPASAGGVFAGKGNVADNPDGSNTFAFPTGTFNFAVTGGRFTVASLNQTTCKFIANISNAKGTIASGTGVFASATGTFRVGASITGVLPHNPGGGCNTSENISEVLDVIQGHATGHINLHGKA